MDDVHFTLHACQRRTDSSIVCNQIILSTYDINPNKVLSIKLDALSVSTRMM